jgi:hypothetical protein
MSNILDLSGADTSGFEPVPVGSYNATVYEVEASETTGTGKLPAGVPMVKVQFAIQDEPYVNRRVFNNFVLPNASQHENSARFLGTFVNFLVGVGEDEAKIKKSGFKMENLKDLEGRECVIRVKIGKTTEEYPDPQNQLVGVKPAGSPTGGGSAARSDLL